MVKNAKKRRLGRFDDFFRARFIPYFRPLRPLLAGVAPEADDVDAEPAAAAAACALRRSARARFFSSLIFSASGTVTPGTKKRCSLNTL